MKISDVMNLTPGKLAKLDRAELAKVVSTLASAANKRLRSIERANLTSSSLAYEYVKRGGGDFSAKGKNLQELDIEYQRVTGFLKRNTSTVKGTKQYVDAREAGTIKFMESIGVSDYKNWTASMKKRFWKMMDSQAMTHALEKWYGAYKGRQAIAVAADVMRDMMNKEAMFEGTPRANAKVNKPIFQEEFNMISSYNYIRSQEDFAMEEAKVLASYFGIVDANMNDIGGNP